MSAPPDFGDELALDNLLRLIAPQIRKRHGAFGGAGCHPAGCRDGSRPGASRVPDGSARGALVDKSDALGLDA